MLSNRPSAPSSPASAEATSACASAGARSSVMAHPKTGRNLATVERKFSNPLRIYEDNRAFGAVTRGPPNLLSAAYFAPARQEQAPGRGAARPPGGRRAGPFRAPE